MTLGPLELANILLAPLALGFAMLGLLRVRADRLFALAFAQLAGSLTLAGLLFAWLALRLDIGAFCFVPLPLGIVTLAITRARVSVASGPDESRLARVALCIAVVLALALVCDHALYGSTTLVVAGDEAAIWAGKAKAIFASDGIGPAFVQRVAIDPALYHPDYPLMNPLLQLFTFANVGAITHLENRLPIFACVIALVLLVASSLRRCSGAWVAAVGTLLVAGCTGIVEECENATSDALVAFGLLAALECHARMRKGDPRYAPAFGLALAFLAWSKNEGMMLAACVAGAALVDAWRRHEPLGAKSLTAQFAPAAGIVGLHFVFNAYVGVSNDLVGNPDAAPFFARLFAQAGTHAPRVAWYAWEHGVHDVAITNGLVVAFVALVIALPHVAATAARVATIALVLGVCGFTLIYFATPHSIEWQLMYSIDRILFQLTPACALGVATICGAALRAPQRQNAALPSR